MTDERIDLRLTAMAHGGYALGKQAGRTVFAPYTLPGEWITARITEDRGRFAYAEMVSIVEASPQRVMPRCPHFGPGRCGGCQWQHIAYPAQLIYKRDIVLDQLKRIGGITDVPVYETVPSPQPWYYRARAAFHVATEGQLGFVSTDPTRIEPVEVCHIVQPEVLNLALALVLDDENVERVQALVGEDEQGMLILSTRDDLAPELEVDFPVSINLLLSDNEPVNLIGASHVYHAIRGRRFRVTAGSFFQVNLPVAEILVDVVLQGLNLEGGEAVLDLYAGVGLFSAFLAERASLVTLVESYPPAVTDADENLAGFEHVDLFEGGVGPVLRGLLDEGAGPYDAAVVDPPRTGLEADVIEALEELAVQKLIYVSCDPATLARDARQLQGRGYRLIDVQPVDMFPQTYHIECVARFAGRG